MHTLQNFINGRFVPAKSGKTIKVFEPATGQEYATVPDSDASDINDAVKAAATAFPAWRELSVSDRAKHLNRLADAIDANLESLARAESIDTGKPLSLARAVDIPRAAANLRFFAGAALYTASECHDFDGGGVPPSQGGGKSLNYTLRRARGVAGLISPWNLPLYLLTWKIGPALATGNTAVCKPSEVTPRTACMLAELARDIGLPPGVLNIVHGGGAGAGGSIVTHPDVPTISFTGSTSVGRWIAREAGPMLKRISLELGGKNPLIVFDDVPLDGPDGAIAIAARAAFLNQGQICLCGSRILVHTSRFEAFVNGLAQAALSMRNGDPLELTTQQGAVVSKVHLQRIAAYVDLARKLGGRVHCGGQSPAPAMLPERCRNGWFYEPTVITGLGQDCRVIQEEIFGPVVTVQSFESDDEAIALANGTEYGLASVILTSNGTRAHRVAAAINSGIVWVNCWLVRDLRTPFGGMGQSGLGREGGNEALRFFTELKNVCVRV